MAQTQDSPTRSQLVDYCKQLIGEAYQEATEMIVAYLESHPGEPTATLCKEIDPDNWNALRNRVQRLQEKRRSEAISARTGTLPETQKREERRVRHAVKENPELVAELVASDPELVRQINLAAVRAEGPREHEPRPKTAPDWDKRYQDAAAEIVRSEADRRDGKWTPNDITEAHRHFLIMALNEPGSVDARKLVDEVDAYLKEVAS